MAVGTTGTRGRARRKIVTLLAGRPGLGAVEGTATGTARPPAYAAGTGTTSARTGARNVGVGHAAGVKVGAPLGVAGGTAHAISGVFVAGVAGRTRPCLSTPASAASGVPRVGRTVTGNAGRSLSESTTIGSEEWPLGHLKIPIICRKSGNAVAEATVTPMGSRARRRRLRRS